MNITFPNKTKTQHNDSETSKVIKTTIYGIILFISLVGNVLLILGIKRNVNGRMRTVSNLLIASLAVSDLMLTIWSFPERITRTATNDAWLIPGVGGSILCKIVNFTEKLSITVSVLHLGALALERFLAVFYPYQTIIKIHFVKYITGCIWTFSALYWSPILYYGKIIGNKELRCEVRRFMHHWRRWYLAFIIILCGVMISILILYTALAISLFRRKNPVRLASQRNKSDHIKRRVVIMVGIIIVTFYACFLPYWIGWVWCSYASSMPKHICNQTYKFISILLSNVSCMANPIICFTFIGYFRFSFKAILKDPLNRKYRELRVKLRRKSVSATELDTVIPHSKNGGKNCKYFSPERKVPEDKLNALSSPLINSNPTAQELNNSHGNSTTSPVEKKGENTNLDDAKVNRATKFQCAVNDTKTSQTNDQNSFSIENSETNVLTIYVTPL